jgi:hypothetical protein
MKNKYKSLAVLEEDIILMCNNAREYNVEGSQIYNDATTIMRFARQKRIDIEAQFPDIPEVEEKPAKKRKSSGKPIKEEACPPEVTPVKESCFQEFNFLRK